MGQSDHHPRGKALRAQALALRAQADALDSEADALEVEAGTGSSGAAIQPLDFVPSKSVTLPRTTLDNLRKKGLVRSARVGREVFVSRADVDRWLAEQSVQESRAAESREVQVEESTDPFERARIRARARSERRAS